MLSTVGLCTVYGGTLFLQRVLIQITQEICKRPGLNKAGFDMPTIFVPTLAGKVSVTQMLLSNL